MKRSTQVAAPLVAAAAMAMLSGCHHQEMQRCVDENNKVVDPSFHNWMGLALAVREGQVSDFPLCNKSFNLSYCGHDL